MSEFKSWSLFFAGILILGAVCCLPLLGYWLVTDGPDFIIREVVDAGGKKSKPAVPILTISFLAIGIILAYAGLVLIDKSGKS